ncbi:hypothetical protein V1517DRAFT_331139 [Lipomyces orientalis]|uniref:Uncharacterized protein n=1 Tax=Lipomyces orientalis TaxID=1233043 RepID=A0ACC3TFK3_9ASCO
MWYCLQNLPLSLQSQLPVPKLPTQLPRKPTGCGVIFRQENFLMNGLRRGTKRREIRCTLITKGTGKQCNWSTTDSKRQTPTTNIRVHLKEKHGILPHGVPEPAAAAQSLLSLASGFIRRNSQG